MQRGVFKENLIPPTANIQNCKYMAKVNYLLIFNKQSTTSVSYNLVLKSLHLRLSCG